MAIISQRKVAAIHTLVTIFLLLIGQKARKSGCDWFIQSNNRCPITVPVYYWTMPEKWL